MSNHPQKFLGAVFVAAAGCLPTGSQAIEQDSKLHMAGSYLLYCGSKNILGLSDSQSAMVSLGIGALKELVYDRGMIDGHRGTPSWSDMGYDLVGAGLAYATCPNLRGSNDAASPEPKREGLTLGFVQQSLPSGTKSHLAARYFVTPDLSVTASRGGVSILFKKELF